MTSYIREIVSGHKSRFVDPSSSTNLDLSYITDQLIIMGYPASGMEGLYRNKRSDAKKFLDERHGKNYWVFNFCPVRENGYGKEVFEGRVSRWPFPDHHAPPLAVLPLAAREISNWLRGSPDRVAVLHCKAGKGRSGTLACAYLLTHPSPTSPQLAKSHTSAAWAALQQVSDSKVPDAHDSRPKSPLARAEEDDQHHHHHPKPTTTLESILDLHTAQRMKQPKPSSSSESAAGVIANSAKGRRGVSIPSQRRWLWYWSLILGGEAPEGYGGFWDMTGLDSGVDGAPSRSLADPMSLADPSQTSARLDSTTRPTQVRITQLTMRIKKPSGLKTGLVQAANTIIEKTTSSSGSVDGKTKATPRASWGSENLWASFARYDEELVDLLAKEYKAHREVDFQHGLDATQPEATHLTQHGHGGLFDTERWDEGKMVRSFARFKAEELPTTTEEKEKRKISTYAFAPISDKVFRDTIASDITTSEPVSGVQTPLQQEPTEEEEIDALNVASTPTLGELGKSREPAAPTNAPVDGLVVDAHREMRIKIYMGQLFLCWAWIVPLFHMKPPSSPSTSSSTTSNSDTTSSNITNINGGLPLAYHPSTAQTGKAKLVLSMEGGAKELDFALGIGADILDLEIDMEWVVPTGGGLDGVGNVDGDAGNAPGAVSGEVQGRTGSADTEAGQGGVAKTIQAIAQGGVTDPRAVVNAKQAVEGV